jgi:hypothetical protein
MLYSPKKAFQFIMATAVLHGTSCMCKCTQSAPGEKFSDFLKIFFILISSAERARETSVKLVENK